MTHPLTNALAMRTAALKVIDPGTGDFDMGLWFAVKALPLEADHAAIVAEAVRLPEIAALIEASKAFRFEALTGGKSFGVYTALNAALSALETP